MSPSSLEAPLLDGRQHEQDVVRNPLLLTRVVVAADWTRDDIEDVNEQNNNSYCSCSSSSLFRSAAAAARPDLFALALAHSAAFWALFTISRSSCAAGTGSSSSSGDETGSFWSPRAVTTAAALTYELAALATAATLLVALSNRRAKERSSVERVAASLAGAMFSVQWGAFSYLFWAALVE